MDFETVLLFWVNRLSFLSRKELQRRFAVAGHKIAAEEWAALLMLWQQDGLSPSELSDATTRDRTTTTRQIDRLVKKELVTRNGNREDGRRVEIKLTRRGRHMKKILVPIAMDFISDATDGIKAKDIDVTMKTLKAISARILAMEQ